MSKGTFDQKSLTIPQLADAYATKKISPVEFIEDLFKKIKTENKIYNAYITINYELAIEEAKKAEKDIFKGNVKGPLHGIPIAVKDLIFTKDMRTTMGSKAFENFYPDYDATVVKMIKEQGGIIVGKANTDQFAYNVTGETSYYGPTKNPYNQEKISGGSSSGSAVAVARNLAVASLGTDTGGSIRIPSSFCGLVGMKPTMGSISNYGSYPLSLSMDHIGPMTKDITGNALFLNNIVGEDAKDIHSIKRKQEDFTRKIGSNINDTTIGIPSEFIKIADNEILDKFESTVLTLKRLGATIKEIEMPDMKALDEASTTIAYSEIFAHKEELIETKGHLLDDDIIMRIRRGKKYKAYEYVKAQRAKHAILAKFNQLFKDIDFIVLPTVPVLPPNIGQKDVIINGESFEDKSLISKFTGSINLIGLPALSLHWAFSSNGLPIGLQIIGKKYDEANIYKLGYALEQSR